MVLQLCSWTSEKHSIVYGTTGCMLYKPGLLGVLPSSLKWIQNHLADRSLFVQIENVMSKPFAISSGVPQGSHLGPVHFPAFINDLPDTCRSSTDIYAVSLFCIKAIRKRNSTDLDKLQESITNASHWAGGVNSALARLCFSQ